MKKMTIALDAENDLGLRRQLSCKMDTTSVILKGKGKLKNIRLGKDNITLRLAVISQI